MKKRILLFLIVIVAVLIGIFWYVHPTHYSFNDRFIIGNTQDRIIEKYGEPYSVGADTITYMIQDNTPEMIMSYDNSLWYVIVFENGTAKEVYLRKGYIGG